ncbi:MAG: gamma-glutamyltransferase [Candidatus Bathyarchaeia archaeon]
MFSGDYLLQQRKWRGSSRLDCIAENGMVSSKHPLISKTGVEMMRRGGNAVDAAVAAAFMDCVVEPGMNGIGGEGVMAIHLASDENIIIDYVGRPSKDCTPDMYELEEGTDSSWGWSNVKNDENRVGHKACTTPGTVAGLTEALERYGTMSLEEVMEPAIHVAEEGFIVGWWTASHIFRRMRFFWGFDEWRRIYLHEDIFPFQPHTHGMEEPEKLVNRDLAKSLSSISQEGAEVFYDGWIANAIEEEMNRGGGLITKEDLAMYKPIIHQPDPGSYRGHEIVYDPTHSGTTMMQILNILEGYDLPSMGYGSADALHLTAEAIGLAFADRFKYMGDPGYVDVPQKGMASKDYAEELRAKISIEKAGAIEPGNPWPHEPECTTALAVADGYGNMVCINQTLVNSFGCGVVIPGTGIVMNNAMYGLDPEPGHANSIDGRKRRIQNVCPTIVLKEGGPFIAIGAPGGRNIQVSIGQTIVHVIDYDMNIQEAVDAPRITRETSTIYVDNRFPKEVRDELADKGHDLVWIDPELKSWGRPVAVLRDPETSLFHGGVYTLFTGFESIAIGY